MVLVVHVRLNTPRFYWGFAVLGQALGRNQSLLGSYFQHRPDSAGAIPMDAFEVFAAGPDTAGGRHFDSAASARASGVHLATHERGSELAAAAMRQTSDITETPRRFALSLAIAHSP